MNFPLSTCDDPVLSWDVSIFSLHHAAAPRCQHHQTTEQRSGAQLSCDAMRCQPSPAPASSRRAGSRVVTSPRSAAPPSAALSCPQLPGCQVKGSPAPAGRGRPNHRGHGGGVCFKPFKVARRRYVCNVRQCSWNHLFTPQELYRGI